LPAGQAVLRGPPTAAGGGSGQVIVIGSGARVLELQRRTRFNRPPAIKDFTPIAVK